jgi:hypothetical protein
METHFLKNRIQKVRRKNGAVCRIAMETVAFGEERVLMIQKIQRRKNGLRTNFQGA